MMYFNTVTLQNLKITLLWLLLHRSSLWLKYCLWYNRERTEFFVGLFVQFYMTHRMGRLNDIYKNSSGFLVCSSALWNTQSCILLYVTKDGVNPLYLRWLEKSQHQPMFPLWVLGLAEQPEAAWPGSPGGTWVTTWKKQQQSFAGWTGNQLLSVSVLSFSNPLQPTSRSSVSLLGGWK